MCLRRHISHVNLMNNVNYLNLYHDDPFALSWYYYCVVLPFWTLKLALEYCNEGNTPLYEYTELMYVCVCVCERERDAFYFLFYRVA